MFKYSLSPLSLKRLLSNEFYTSPSLSTEMIFDPTVWCCHPATRKETSRTWTVLVRIILMLLEKNHYQLSMDV